MTVRYLCTVLLLAANIHAADPRWPEWPKWLHVGGELRGRAEGFTGNGFRPGNDDGYYLHRIRLNLGVEAAPWLRFFGQAQDSHVFGYNSSPSPTSLTNTMDLRQAHVEFGRNKGNWRLRAGRQEIAFGEERLVGGSNWGNVARSFDGLRATLNSHALSADVFGAAVVVPLRANWDQPQTANRLYGIYGSVHNLPNKAILEPYFLVRTAHNFRNEAGAVGFLQLYTTGFRSVAKLPLRLDYDVEMAKQNGDAANGGIGAWAGHWQVGYTLPSARITPRLLIEYNYATGDKNPNDGRRSTFDQLYPTNHQYYGIADRVGWRNMENLRTGIDIRISPRTRINADYHNFWLATTHDGLYLAGGEQVVINRAATGRHIGQEADIQLFQRLGEHVNIVLGYSHMFPGDFLKQSSPGSSVTGPYAMWTYAF